MKKLAINHRNSLSARLSLWVIFFVVLLFVASLSVMYYYAYTALKAETHEHAEQTLKGTVKYIDNLLHRTEVAVKMTHWNVEHHLNKPDSMLAYTRDVLKNNTDIIGLAIAFEPGFYGKEDSLFMAYSYRTSLEEDAQIGSSPTFGNTPYTDQNWYSQPIKMDSCRWVRSVGSDVGEVYASVITYSIPLHDQTGKVVGVVAADLSIEQVTKMVMAVKPFPNSYCALLSRRGHFIVHPDSTKLFHEDVFNQITSQSDEVKEVAGKMLAGQRGDQPLRLDGVNSHVFYMPFKNIGWSIALICPENELYEPLNNLLLLMTALTIAGLLLLLLYCYIVIRRQLRPLRQLTEATGRIAEGELDKPLPVSHRLDEIGHLQNSFQTMQSSLADHIGKINQMATVLQERNVALNVANEKAKEAELVKAAFRHSMTGQMIQPVSEMLKDIDSVRKALEVGDNNELAHLTDSIDKSSKDVIKVLNQMLEQSQQTQDVNLSPNTMQ